MLRRFHGSNDTSLFRSVLFFSRIMDFLTSELLGVEETLHWKSELTKHESIWLDGRLTAGEHAALVKQNHQLDPSSPLAKLIAENR
jgi:PKHD-type hydroxylase